MQTTVRVKQFKCGCITDKDGFFVHIFCTVHKDQMLELSKQLIHNGPTDLVTGMPAFVNNNWKSNGPIQLSLRVKAETYENITKDVGPSDNLNLESGN